MSVDRFVIVQKRDYEKAFLEIKNGKKVSHWMWYIFPQIDGLGKSATSCFYAIKGIDEGIEYLSNEYLYNNLINICSELLKCDKKITDIFGSVDSLKLKSSMTLFNYLMEIENSCYKKSDIFLKVLDKFYFKEMDNKTLEIINIYTKNNKN